VYIHSDGWTDAQSRPYLLPSLAEVKRGKNDLPRIQIFKFKTAGGRHIAMCKFSKFEMQDGVRPQS